MLEWAVPAVDLLTEAEREAVATLQSGLRFDVFSQPMFWENVIARVLDGTTTDHGALHDVEVPIWGRLCRAEVKFSRGFLCRFTRIRGKDWTRQVFKWAKPRGCSGKGSADAVILVGLDEGLLFFWLVPTSHIGAGCASITMTSPLARSGKQASPWDAYATPFDGLLPAFAATCHGHYADMFEAPDHAR